MTLPTSRPQLASCTASASVSAPAALPLAAPPTGHTPAQTTAMPAVVPRSADAAQTMVAVSCIENRAIAHLRAAAAAAEAAAVLTSAAPSCGLSPPRGCTQTQPGCWTHLSVTGASVPATSMSAVSLPWRSSHPRYRCERAAAMRGPRHTMQPSPPRTHHVDFDRRCSLSQQHLVLENRSPCQSLAHAIVACRCGRHIAAQTRAAD